MKCTLATIFAVLFITNPSFAAADAPDTRDSLSKVESPTHCPVYKPVDSKDWRTLQDSVTEPGAKVDFDLALSSPELKKLRQVEDARRSSDWAYICRFKADNNRIKASGTAPKTVFIGDSITENWEMADRGFFAKDNLNRGIGGQTSSQILLRFYADAIALKPTTVHLMIGTNDIAEAAGKFDDEDYKNNIRAMVDIAKKHDVGVVIGSIPPSNNFVWRPDLHPAARIVSLNRWLKEYAKVNGLIYADYFSVLVGEDNGMKAKLSNDHVHPNRLGYDLMNDIANRAIAEAAKSGSRRDARKVE